MQIKTDDPVYLRTLVCCFFCQKGSEYLFLNIFFGCFLMLIIAKCDYHFEKTANLIILLIMKWQNKHQNYLSLKEGNVLFNDALNTFNL